MGIKLRVNAQGQQELYDEETGEIVSVGKKRQFDRSGARMGHSMKKKPAPKWVKVLNADGEICTVPAGTNPDDLPAKKNAWTYSEVTKDQICTQVMKGLSLLKVSKTEGFPPYDVLCNWRIKYPEFDRSYREAKKLRADYRADQVVEFAETTTKETNIEDRLKTELYKWGASVDDPDTFGSRMKHSGDAQNPVAWIIQTGVPQPEQAPPIEVQAEPLPSKDDDDAGGAP